MEILNYVEKFEVDGNKHGRYGIKLSPMSNTIRFTAKYDNAICAYIVGDFNNWEKLEEFKLNWQLDIEDGTLKMIKDVKFENGLEEGQYRYKYILVDREGDEIWVDNPYGGKNGFKFTWDRVENFLEILSSNKFVTYKAPVELVGRVVELYDKVSFPDINWYLKEEIEGVKLENSYLYVSEDVEEGTEIVVIAQTSDNKYKNEKKIIVSKSLPDQTLVHFLTDDNKYIGESYLWNCWAFQDGCDSKEIDFNIETDFGDSAYMPYHNFIIRKKQWGPNWVNQWAEQSPTFNTGNKENNLYILYGIPSPYNSLKEAVMACGTKIKFAVIDNDRKIKAYLTREPLLGVDFHLYINGEKIEGVSTIIRGREVILTNIPKNINANDLVVVSPSNMYNPCKVTMRSYLDKYYYSKEIGVSFLTEDIVLRLWAPTAYKVEIALYNNYDDLNQNYCTVEEMAYDQKTGTHYAAIDREKNQGKYYLYKLYFRDINNDGEIIDKINYAVDPYAFAVGVNGDKGVLIDINSNDCKPLGWKEDKSPYIDKKIDSIIYEAHVRDFTIDKTSGVSDDLRGTYLGLVEEGTSYIDEVSNKKVSTGIDHLKELGITHIHLLPTYDFGSVDERFKDIEGNRNWGYDPKNYNVPEGSYSTDPYNPITRILEFRQMVQGFHKNGIRVVLDMVYNHMMSTENMDKIVPGYYFRTDYLGRYSNGSGCGNELCTERPMVRKFILDSCSHWIKDYHVDGLRFDLMELMDIKTTKEIVRKTSRIDKNFLIYGEPWKGGDSPVKNGTYKGSQKKENFSVFNDTFRDAIRGDNSPSRGFINGDQHNAIKAWNIVEGLKGSIYTITYNPDESINYMDAHDNYTLWDQIEKTQNYNTQYGQYRDNIGDNILDNYNVRQYLLGASILFTAQGIPFFQGGAEFLRTKQGDHNSYKSGDIINSIKWSDKVKYNEVFEYYKGLIKIRKQYDLFKITSPEDVKKNLSIKFAHNDDKSGVIISSISSEDNSEEFIIIYNGTSIDNYDVNSEISLDVDKEWSIIANGKLAGVEVIKKIVDSNIPLIKSYSAVILRGIALLEK
ncbi:type I pullulanase [Clostridium sp. NSJ-145]|uniref:type I pullulanase n=1 Tax=Clostridium sp. NSJ-145 TaxID=2897777 RepID=UPI001E4DB9F8|nr:type I pullulanase [Clostridium sp. NSJ-145]